MKHYIGLDVSMKETAVCILDEKGKTVHESMELTDPGAIVRCIEKTGLFIEKVGLESGSISRWLTLGLQELGVPAICVDARRMHGILQAKINKNDVNDARGIAHAIRAEIYTEVHLKSDQSVELQVVLSSRSTLINTRVRYASAIRGYLKSVGIRPGALSHNNIEERVNEFMPDLPQGMQDAIHAILSIIHEINQKVDVLEKTIKTLVKDNDVINVLQTIPGVGPIIAAAFVMEIDNPHRFTRSELVPAYLGLTPKQYASGETNIMGHISKQGNSAVRSLLYQAGMLILTRVNAWSKLKVWGMKIQRKRGTKKAAIAIARKLAVIMHQMMLTGNPFKYGEPKEKQKEMHKNKNDEQRDKHDGFSKEKQSCSRRKLKKRAESALAAV